MAGHSRKIAIRPVDYKDRESPIPYLIRSFHHLQVRSIFFT